MSYVPILSSGLTEAHMVHVVMSLTVCCSGIVLGLRCSQIAALWKTLSSVLCGFSLIGFQCILTGFNHSVMSFALILWEAPAVTLSRCHVVTGYTGDTLITFQVSFLMTKWWLTWEGTTSGHSGLGVPVHCAGCKVEMLSPLLVVFSIFISCQRETMAYSRGQRSLLSFTWWFEWSQVNKEDPPQSASGSFCHLPINSCHFLAQQAAQGWSCPSSVPVLQSVFLQGAWFLLVGNSI